MLWLTLFNKLGKQPLKNTKHTHVHALLRNPATGEYETVDLDIKFDGYGRPYLVRDEKQDYPNPHKPRKRGSPTKRVVQTDDMKQTFEFYH